MTIVRKAASSEVGPDLEFVMSDETVDRYGDVVSAAGWQLAAFRKNPIALFGHSSGFPIGRWKNVRVDGRKLVGQLEFATEGTSLRIDELRRLVEQGILRAVSVGFRPIDDEPMDEKDPWGGRRYTKQELLECSLVSVPANPSALAKAMDMQISDDVLTLAFGEHADGGGVVRRGATGERAAPRNAPIMRQKMTTLAERIVDAQNDLVASRDKLVELNAADMLDLDAIEELNQRIEVQERTLDALKSSEAKLAGTTTKTGEPVTPAINRRPLGFPQREVKGLDLMVRSAVTNGVALFTGKSVDQVLDERYPGHEATAAVAKSAAPLGTTGTSGFAAELVQTTYAAFVDALRGKSIYPGLRAGGISQSFDAAGTAYIPSRTAGGANGSFFSEGNPIRVGRITVAADTMTAKKMGVIIPFSRELAKRSTPSLEGIVRSAIIEDTAKVLDQALLDATAADAARPAGLLNGVSAVASGYGGGDYQAVIEDINALMAVYDAADASDGIALVMHPAQARKLAMLPGPDGTFGWADRFMSEFTVLRSTHATAGRLIAIRLPEFITASGDAPQFDVSNTATIHMEDSSPAAIGTAGTPNVVAAPVRSFFQTDSMGLRMVMDVAWKMRRSGMVQWIDG
ncbi:phage major capsid protein, partial [Thauera sp.]|uniref:phage major capsid protein n=1 Tax=Thauera sp. TaxID=1905334 RepID=UPI002CD45A28